jgi:uncharacterized protein YbjT (DUF2867 family)
MTTQKLVLITGSTGYIGRNLIPRLLERGYRVRCLARDATQLRGQTWFSQVEIVECDVNDCEALTLAMKNVSVAYYLIHNMSKGRNYPLLDLSSAANFAGAASICNVEQIIYLGGLADPSSQIGLHMRSRLQTGEILRQGNVPVTEFRASVIIGPGSISFEMIRYLTEQFPILFGPRWLNNLSQPIATKNVLDYLLAALETPACRGKILEIGGPEVMTYANTMLEYARLRGLKRRLITLPVAPVKLMAYWVDKLTPIPQRIAAPLIDSMQADSVVLNFETQNFFPNIRLQEYRAAIKDALSQLSPLQLEPIWDNGFNPVIILKHAGFFIDFRQIYVQVSCEAVYQVFTQLGGKWGWLYLNWLWKLRGLFDRFIGGPGMRGRQDEIEEGEVVDFYRVERLEQGQRMRLRAELKAPGAGWMEWQVKPQPDNGSILSQTAYFAPKGTLGFLYWYLLSFIHQKVFAGLIRNIARRASKIKPTT